MSDTPKDLYHLMGLPFRASAKDVLRGFPIACQKARDAGEWAKLAPLKEARDILSDPQSRRKYITEFQKYMQQGHPYPLERPTPEVLPETSIFSQRTPEQQEAEDARFKELEEAHQKEYEEMHARFVHEIKRIKKETKLAKEQGERMLLAWATGRPYRG
jgi:curved DNA-binding protein CbpA